MLASARVSRHERAELLHAIEAIDDIVDGIETAAHELPRGASALPRERLARATGVIKDLARTSMAAATLIEEQPASREPLHARAHELNEELRAELRVLHRAVAEHESDVLAASRAITLLRQLRTIGQACNRALRAIEVLAGAHA
jgi:uncharacterized protein Yka (UPF0111/DUF47 family)